MHVTRLLLGLLGCTLVAGCGSLFDQRDSCLLVISTRGTQPATPAQVAMIEKRLASDLNDRGMKVTHDIYHAEMIARVDFIPDPSNPDDGEVVVRWVGPNPRIRASVSVLPSGSESGPGRSSSSTGSLGQISEYEMKSLGRDSSQGPTPSR